MFAVGRRKSTTRLFSRLSKIDRLFDRPSTFSVKLITHIDFSILLGKTMYLLTAILLMLFGANWNLSMHIGTLIINLLVISLIFRELSAVLQFDEKSFAWKWRVIWYHYFCDFLQDILWNWSNNESFCSNFTTLLKLSEGKTEKFSLNKFFFRQINYSNLPNSFTCTIIYFQLKNRPVWPY